MFHIVEKRRWYFLVSALVILIGLAVMIYNTATTGTPFRLAIDFTGGSLWQLQFDRAVPPAELRQIFVDSGIEDPAVTTLGDGTALQVRLQPIDAQVGKVAARLSVQPGHKIATLAFGPLRQVLPNIRHQVL